MVNLIAKQRQSPFPVHFGPRFLFDDSFWNRFWDDHSFHGPLRAPRLFSADWMPDVDISETDKDIIVEANVAGYEPKDISVEIDDNVLTIKGEMEKNAEEKKKQYYRQERCAGSFFRQIALPPIDDTQAKCQAKNGTLTVIVPKKEAQPTSARLHKLTIES